MIWRTLAVSILTAGTAFAAYTYDYVASPPIQDNTRWNQNGSGIAYGYSEGDATQFYAQAPGASLISKIPISGANPNDYEVRSTLELSYAGGTLIHFLRADSINDKSGVGTYTSVELVLPGSFRSPGWATLNINQCTSGSVLTIASVSLLATDGMTLRSVIWGTNLWVFIDNNRVWAGTVTAMTGNPGIGGYGTKTGFRDVRLGPHETTAPGSVAQPSFQTYPTSQSISMRWQGVADDPNGIGVWGYQVNRGGSLLGYANAPTYADRTAQSNTAYSYSISAIDFHGNTGPPYAVSISTLPTHRQMRTVWEWRNKAVTGVRAAKRSIC